MDFTKLTSFSEVSTLHLRHPILDTPMYVDTDPVTGLRTAPDTEGVPITITFLNPDSAAARKVQADILRRTQGKRNKKNIDIEVLVSEQLSKTAVGWTGFTTDDAPDVFTTEKLFGMFEQMNSRWMREQAAEFIGDRTNFLPM